MKSNHSVCVTIKVTWMYFNARFKCKSDGCHSPDTDFWYRSQVNSQCKWGNWSFSGKTLEMSKGWSFQFTFSVFLRLWLGNDTLFSQWDLTFSSPIYSLPWVFYYLSGRLPGSQTHKINISPVSTDTPYREVAAEFLSQVCFQKLFCIITRNHYSWHDADSY